MDIHSIYIDYLKYKNDENAEERNDGKFHASSAGSCFRKQMYRLYEFPQEELDEKSLKILRVGTLIHKDFEKALLYHIKMKKNKGTIYTEYKINIKHLNVTGTLDAGEYIESEKNNIYEVYDLKTTAAYKWSTMFGIKKNRQPLFEYDKYRMQLATYAIGVQEEKPIDIINMFLVFYNKNTSMMREVKVYADEWIDKAQTYWEELNEIDINIGPENFEKELKPGIQFGVPFEDWECSYCPYETICPSKLKNKK